MPVDPRYHAVTSPPGRRPITTLFELISTLQEHGGLDDESITTLLVHLCRSGRLRFLRPPSAAAPEISDEP